MQDHGKYILCSTQPSKQTSICLIELWRLWWFQFKYINIKLWHLFKLRVLINYESFNTLWKHAEWEKPLIFISVVFFISQHSRNNTDHILSAAASEMGHHFREVKLQTYLCNKGGIIYHRCLLFIFSNPFIMKVHYMTPDSHITPVCMWNTCRYLIYRRSCRTVLFLLWKLKSRSALRMCELSKFVTSTGNAIIPVLTIRGFFMFIWQIW